MFKVDNLFFNFYIGVFFKYNDYNWIFKEVILYLQHKEIPVWSSGGGGVGLSCTNSLNASCNFDQIMRLLRHSFEAFLAFEVSETFATFEKFNTFESWDIWDIWDTSGPFAFDHWFSERFTVCSYWWHQE